MRNAVATVQVTLTEVNLSRLQTKNSKFKPSDALTFLRVAAKSYVQEIPFAPFMVDRAFDSVEATIDAHQEEAGVIIERLGGKMSEIIEHHKNMTVPAALEMLQVVKEETGRLHEVVVQAVGPAANSAGESVQRIAEEGAVVGLDVFNFIKSNVDQWTQGYPVESEVEQVPEKDKDASTK